MNNALYLGDLPIVTGTMTGHTGYVRDFAGAHLLVTGDSITEKNFRAALNWHDYLKTRLGLAAVHNDARSGTGFQRPYGSNASLYARIDSWPQDIDFILVMASMNDGTGTQATFPLGTFADTQPGASYYGACRGVVEKLLNNYPLTPVGMLTPPPRGPATERGASYGVQGWYHPWCEALKEVCAHYGVPCLDLYHGSGLRPWLAANNAEFFSCAQAPQGDGIHPNAAGQEILARAIGEFMRGL